MTPREKQTAKKISRIMRAARKKLALTQGDISKTLGISQGCLSKIENGLLIPSAQQWVEFCRLTKISTESLIDGYIESVAPAEVFSATRTGSFKLPKKYAADRSSKVRAMLPFVQYLDEALGAKKSNDYFEYIKMDKDFFVDLDNQISLNFCLDLSRQLISQKFLKPKDVVKLVYPVNSPELHGSLGLKYSANTDPLILLDVLVQNAKFYECNFDYVIEDRKEKSTDVSVTPAAHLKSFGYHNDHVLGDFLCQYKQRYFERFVFYGQVKKTSTTPFINELECIYKGSPKCIYRMQVAA